MAAEDAALFRAVLKLRTGERRRTADPAIDLCREQHAEDRRGKVNPSASPDPAGQRGGDSARRVDAHVRKRRLNCDAEKDERAGKQSCKARDAWSIRDKENHEHHAAGDERHRKKRNAGERLPLDVARVGSVMSFCKSA